MSIQPKQEFLHALHYRCWDACQDPGDPYGLSPDHQCHVVRSFTVTKTTATRFYFTDGYGRSYFVTRSAFNANGTAYHRGVSELLYLSPPELPHRLTVKTKSLSELRQAMADAHPDRGGDRDSFQAARARYLDAKRVMAK